LRFRSLSSRWSVHNGVKERNHATAQKTNRTGEPDLPRREGGTIASHENGRVAKSKKGTTCLYFFSTIDPLVEFIQFSRTLNRAQWNLKRDDGYETTVRDAKFLSPFSLRKNTLTYFFHSMRFRTNTY
jgi:hypothetical protein